MPHDPEYDAAVNTAIDKIQATIPKNLVQKFRAESKITRGDFQACNPGDCGEICAIDGSNVMLLESGSMALVLFRAAQSTFMNLERTRRSLTPLTFSMIGPGVENQDFPRLYKDCFSVVPGTPVENEDRTRAASILRDTVEYWVTETMAGSLGSGALLLRDGPLRVSHASHDPVLTRIENTCRLRDIGLAGVSKRTTATWGGGHPILPSVNGLAKELGVKAPWWIWVDTEMLDHAQFPQWQHGQMYIACLHPRAKSPLKIDLPVETSASSVRKVMDRLAACSGDGRIPGYPYPLFDAHRTVVLTEEIVEQVRSDLMRRIADTGIERHTFDILFGDYHDEFARY
ncbi:MAG: DNA double-strand break repair nuclease NurA [Methanomicrobiales archaeon]